MTRHINELNAENVALKDMIFETNSLLPDGLFDPPPSYDIVVTH